MGKPGSPSFQSPATTWHSYRASFHRSAHCFKQTRATRCVLQQQLQPITDVSAVECTGSSGKVSQHFAQINILASFRWHQTICCLRDSQFSCIWSMLQCPSSSMSLSAISFVQILKVPKTHVPNSRLIKSISLAVPLFKISIRVHVTISLYISTAIVSYLQIRDETSLRNAYPFSTTYVQNFSISQY